MAEKIAAVWTKRSKKEDSGVTTASADSAVFGFVLLTIEQLTHFSLRPNRPIFENFFRSQRGFFHPDLVLAKCVRLGLDFQLGELCEAVDKHFRLDECSRLRVKESAAFLRMSM